MLHFPISSSTVYLIIYLQVLCMIVCVFCLFIVVFVRSSYISLREWKANNLHVHQFCHFLFYSFITNILFNALFLCRNHLQLICCISKNQITSIILLSWEHRRCHICHSTLKKNHQVRKIGVYSSTLRTSFLFPGYFKWNMWSQA